MVAEAISTGIRRNEVRSVAANRPLAEALRAVGRGIAARASWITSLSLEALEQRLPPQFARVDRRHISLPEAEWWLSCARRGRRRRLGL
jgi:hypothetical protein